MLELMVRARKSNNAADWLLRSQHNRALPDGGKLWSRVLEREPLGEIRFTLPGGKGRKARSVRQQVRSRRIELADGNGGLLEVTCVVATEIGAPAGVKPIEWRLVTNRQVDGLQSAVELIEWYRARWEIEMLFMVLKQGCRVEALQLSTVERVERALALFLVVAWRVARLMRMGRNLPDLDASLLFETDEWQAAYILAKKAVPKTAPQLNEVLRMVASLGGFLGRKCDGEPGVKTIWLGLQRVMDFAAGIRFAREAQQL
jgi:hypothetical protein